MKLKIG